MQELLNLYTELIKAATDDQVAQHLTNLLTDAAAMEAAVKAVIEQAKARVNTQNS